MFGGNVVGAKQGVTAMKRLYPPVLAAGSKSESSTTNPLLLAYRFAVR